MWLLTPFGSNFKHLKHYWWHRFLVVLFVIVVFSVGVCTWQFTFQEKTTTYTDCIKRSGEQYSAPVSASSTMTTPDVAGFIKAAHAQGISDDDIYEHLQRLGYVNAQGQITATKQSTCAVLDPVHPFLDFGLGLLAANFTFYLLQLIYYKIILYIVLGST